MNCTEARFAPTTGVVGLRTAQDNLLQGKRVFENRAERISRYNPADD